MSNISTISGIEKKNKELEIEIISKCLSIFKNSNKNNNEHNNSNNSNYEDIYNNDNNNDEHDIDNNSNYYEDINYNHILSYYLYQ